MGSVSDTVVNDVSSRFRITANGATSDITLGGAITGGSDIQIHAGRNLIQNAGAPITTGATGVLQLYAAGGNQANTGTLTLGDNLSVGTGGLDLISGLDGGGNRLNADLSSSLTFQGGSTGWVELQGFANLTLPSQPDWRLRLCHRM